MDELDAVFENYHVTVAELIKVPKQPSTPALLSLKQELPEYFKRKILEFGRSPAAYRFKGSAGELNFNFANVPWVGIYRTDITTKAKKGYYIVLLFKRDMSGCYLSLNQGYVQFEDRFGSGKRVQRKLQEASTTAIRLLPISPPVIAGRIDLGATGSLVRGYEMAAIASYEFSHSEGVDEEEFAQALEHLLNLYDELHSHIQNDVFRLLPPTTEDEYQQSAIDFALGEDDPKKEDETTGGKEKSKKTISASRESYTRDAKEASRALRYAEFKCEVDPSHETFTSKAQGSPYVEAHHLIPMGVQDQFDYSLDVFENIVALCPLCHRKLHHALFSEKKTALSKLFSMREGQLKKREIVVSRVHLFQFYKAEIEEG